MPDFHEEYYRKALKEMAVFASTKTGCMGWLEWLKNTHPDLFKKLEHTQAKIHSLWSKTDNKSLEEWKQAVKNEIDATKWAIEKYKEEWKQAVKNENEKDDVLY